MSLDKAIQHGKERRKPYSSAKSVDTSCRNRGWCSYCQSNRHHNHRRRQSAANDSLMEWKDRHYQQEKVSQRQGSSSPFH
jgi:hypothetical protein